jgi:hypothetical protein
MNQAGRVFETPDLDIPHLALLAAFQKSFEVEDWPSNTIPPFPQFL